MRNMQYLKIVIYGPLKCKNILFRVFEASIYYAYDKKEKKLYVKTSTGNYEISLDDYYAKEEARKLAERQAQLKAFCAKQVQKCRTCKVQQVQSLMSEYRFHLQKYKIPLLQSICKQVLVSNILEDNATDEQKTNGLDIADFLLMTETPLMALQRLIKQQPPLQHLIDCIGLVLV